MKPTSIPIYYNLRNLWMRKSSTLITATAIAMVVLIIDMEMSLVAGIDRTFVASGNRNNLVVTSREADSEIVSQITREQVDALESLPGIAVDGGGRHLISPEVAAQFTFEQNDGSREDVLVRGVSPESFVVHREVIPSSKLSYSGGEALVGVGLVGRFKHLYPGDSFTLNHRPFVVRGLLRSGGTSFESEIWVTSRELKETLNWRRYNSVRLTVAPGAGVAELIQRIENDPQLQLRVEPEPQFYAKEFYEAAAMRSLIYGGALLAGPAAALAAMITMYGWVASRAREIGTIRAIGFPPYAISVSFLVEAAMLGAVSALIALPIAPQFGRLTYSSGINAAFRTVVLHFEPTSRILVVGSAIGIALAVTGGLLPARWAARLTVVEALHSH